jgi:hypothetical protein
MTATSWTHERAKLASIIRHRSGDQAAIDDARRNLRAARLEDAIRAAVDAAPPLNDEQRTRLAAILRGQGAAHA